MPSDVTTPADSKTIEATTRFQDGLGVRVVTTDAFGEPIEQLKVCPDLAALDSAIRERVSRLINFRHVRYVRLRGTDRLTNPEKDVVVAYDAVTGARLSELLDLASHTPLRVDIDIALQIVRELLPAVAVLHDSRNVTHGALAPERLVITNQGRLIIVDHGLGLALGKLGYSRRRYWQQLSVAVPTGSGKVVFDARTDVIQIGVVALALILGRQIGRDEYPDDIRGLVGGARELTAKGDWRAMSSELQSWLERMLPTDHRQPFMTVREAQQAFESLVSQKRYAPNAAALKTIITRYYALIENKGEAVSAPAPAPVVAAVAPEVKKAPVPVVAPPAAPVVAKPATVATPATSAITAKPAVSARPTELPVAEKEKVEKTDKADKVKPATTAQVVTPPPVAKAVTPVAPVVVPPPVVATTPTVAAPPVPVTVAKKPVAPPTALKGTVDETTLPQIAARPGRSVRASEPPTTFSSEPETSAAAPSGLEIGPIADSVTPRRRGRRALVMPFDDSMSREALTRAGKLAATSRTAPQPPKPTLPKPIVPVTVAKSIMPATPPAPPKPAVPPAPVKAATPAIAPPPLVSTPVAPPKVVAPPPPIAAYVPEPEPEIDAPTIPSRSLIPAIVATASTPRAKATPPAAPAAPKPAVVQTDGTVLDALKALEREDPSQVRFDREILIGRRHGDVESMTFDASPSKQVKQTERADAALQPAKADVPDAAMLAVQSAKVADAIAPKPAELSAFQEVAEDTYQHAEASLALKDLVQPAIKGSPSGIDPSAILQMTAVDDATPLASDIMALEVAADIKPVVIAKPLVQPKPVVESKAVIEPKPIVEVKPTVESKPAPVAKAPIQIQVVKPAVARPPAAAPAPPVPVAKTATPPPFVAAKPATPVTARPADEVTFAAPPLTPAIAPPLPVLPVLPVQAKAEPPKPAAPAPVERPVAPAESKPAAQARPAVEKLVAEKPVERPAEKPVEKPVEKVAAQKSPVAEKVPAPVPVAPAPPVATPVVAKTPAVPIAPPPPIVVPPPVAIAPPLAAVPLAAAPPAPAASSVPTSHVSAPTPMVTPVAPPVVALNAPPATKAAPPIPAVPVALAPPPASTPLATPVAPPVVAVTPKVPVAPVAPAAAPPASASTTPVAPPAVAPEIAFEPVLVGVAAAMVTPVAASSVPANIAVEAMPAKPVTPVAMPIAANTPPVTVTPLAATPVVAPTTVTPGVGPVVMPSIGASVTNAPGMTKKSAAAAAAFWNNEEAPQDAVLPAWARGVETVDGAPVPDPNAPALPAGPLGTPAESSSAYTALGPPVAPISSTAPGSRLRMWLRRSKSGGGIGASSTDLGLSASSGTTYKLAPSLGTVMRSDSSSSSLLNGGGGFLGAAAAEEASRQSTTRIYPRVRVNWRRTLAASVMVALLEGVAFGTAYWYVVPTETGSLVIETTPAGIDILVDGRVSGHTPYSGALAPGRHVIELRQGTNTRVLPVEISSGVQTWQRVTWNKGLKTGQARVTSTAPNARVTLDGKELGVTPLTISTLSAGKHMVTVESNSGTVNTPMSVSPGETTELDVPVYPGWVSVLASVELQIFEGERFLGTTESEKLLLSPGHHKLDFVSEPLGYRHAQMAVVTPGATAALSIVMPKVSVEIEGPTGTELFVDGDVAGKLPMKDLRLPLGTREFVFKLPGNDTRRQVVVLTNKAPMKVAVPQ